MRRLLVALLAAGSVTAIAPASALATIKPTVKPRFHAAATVKPAADTGEDQAS
jgi:hypothetical protein